MKLLEIKELIKEKHHTSIGTKQEKRIHQILKYYLTYDYNCHEVKVGRYFVDVLIDGHVYEIQTRAFNAFRKKLGVLLEDYPVTVVFPISYIKYIVKIDHDGQIVSKRKSNRFAHPLRIFYECYQIKSLLKHPNLDFIIYLFETNEYKSPSLKRKNRLVKINEDPINLIDTYRLYQDFDKIMPKIDHDYTCHEFAKIIKGNYHVASTILNVLNYLGLVTRVGKIGNAYLYQSNC